MNKDQDNKVKSAFIAIAIHALLLLCFLIIQVWEEPDPPIPEYGVELSFGSLSSVSKAASAKPSPQQAPAELEYEVGNSSSQSEESPEVEEVVESNIDPQVDEVESEQETSNQVVDEEPTEQNIEEEEIAVENEAPAPEVVSKNQERKPEEQKEVEEESSDEKENINPPNKSESKQALNDRAILRKGGGSVGANGGSSAAEGAKLELSGWVWDQKPRPNDDSSENGRIVFEIKVDDTGFITAVKTLESTVTPSVERIYYNEVLSLTFSPTTDNSSLAPISTGKVTFIIRSR